jgi:hypothetical protein
VTIVFDGDPQARVKDRDRDRATYVIEAALRNGQISQQDRDLRLERVRSSQTIGELDALVRDVAVAPSSVTSPVTSPVPATAPSTAPAADPYAGVPADLYGPSPKPKAASTTTAGTASRAGRRLAMGCSLMVALFFIVPIAAGVLIFAVSNKAPDYVDTDPIPAGPPFELSAKGIRAYVTAFQDTFDSTQVVRTVFYDGYVISWVRQDDGKMALWDYRDGAFDEFGDPLDDAEDTAPVDLLDLKPAKVMALIRQADETLGVPEPATTYVIYERDVVRDAPHVMVFLSNPDGDSGYLIADVDGNVTYTSAAP